MLVKHRSIAISEGCETSPHSTDDCDSLKSSNEIVNMLLAIHVKMCQKFLLWRSRGHLQQCP
jgi:hypothetical protein